MPRAQPGNKNAAGNRGGGRPSLFTEALGDEIIRRLQAGEWLTRITDDAHMPSYHSAIDWGAGKHGASSEFSQRYNEAIDKRHRNLLEETLDIADDSSGDLKTIERKDGRLDEVQDSEFVARSKLRIETRLKVLALLDRNKYGPKSDLNLTGSMNVKIEEGDADL